MKKTTKICADGRSGTYEVKDGIVTVQDDATGRRKPTQIGNLPVEHVALMLLREIAREHPLAQ